MLTNNIFCVVYFCGLCKPQKIFYNKNFQIYGIREMWFVDCSCMDYHGLLDSAADSQNVSDDSDGPHVT